MQLNEMLRKVKAQVLYGYYRLDEYKNLAANNSRAEFYHRYSTAPLLRAKNRQHLRQQLLEAIESIENRRAEAEELMRLASLESKKILSELSEEDQEKLKNKKKFDKTLEEVQKAVKERRRRRTMSTIGNSGSREIRASIISDDMMAGLPAELQAQLTLDDDFENPATPSFSFLLNRIGKWPFLTKFITDKIGSDYYFQTFLNGNDNDTLILSQRAEFFKQLAEARGEFELSLKLELYNKLSSIYSQIPSSRYLKNALSELMYEFEQEDPTLVEKLDEIASLQKFNDMTDRVLTKMNSYLGSWFTNAQGREIAIAVGDKAIELDENSTLAPQDRAANLLQFLIDNAESIKSSRCSRLKATLQELISSMIEQPGSVKIQTSYESLFACKNFDKIKDILITQLNAYLHQDLLHKVFKPHALHRKTAAENLLASVKTIVLNEQNVAEAYQKLLNALLTHKDALLQENTTYRFFNSGTNSRLYKIVFGTIAQLNFVISKNQYLAQSLSRTSEPGVEPNTHTLKV